MVAGLSVDVRLMMQTRAPQLHFERFTLSARWNSRVCVCVSPQTSHTKPEQIDILWRTPLASIHSGLDYVFNPALGFSFVPLKMPACGTQIGDFRGIKRAKGKTHIYSSTVTFTSSLPWIGKLHKKLLLLLCVSEQNGSSIKVTFILRLLISMRMF